MVHDSTRRSARDSWLFTISRPIPLDAPVTIATLGLPESAFVMGLAPGAGANRVMVYVWLQAPATSISSPPATMLRPGDLPCTQAKQVCACGKENVLFSTAPQLPGCDTRVGK